MAGTCGSICTSQRSKSPTRSRRRHGLLLHLAGALPRESVVGLLVRVGATGTAASASPVRVAAVVTGALGVAVALRPAVVLHNHAHHIGGVAKWLAYTGLVPRA